MYVAAGAEYDVCMHCRLVAVVDVEAPCNPPQCLISLNTFSDGYLFNISCRTHDESGFETNGGRSGWWKAWGLLLHSLDDHSGEDARHETGKKQTMA